MLTLVLGPIYFIHSLVNKQFLNENIGLPINAKKTERGEGKRRRNEGWVIRKVVKKIEWIKNLMIDVFAFLDFSKKKYRFDFFAILIPLELDFRLCRRKLQLSFFHSFDLFTRSNLFCHPIIGHQYWLKSVNNQTLCLTLHSSKIGTSKIGRYGTSWNWLVLLWAFTGFLLYFWNFKIMRGFRFGLIWYTFKLELTTTSG